MMNRPLLTSRVWRLVGWLTAFLFTIFTIYAAAIVVYTLMERAV